MSPKSSLRSAAPLKKKRQQQQHQSSDNDNNSSSSNSKTNKLNFDDGSNNVLKQKALFPNDVGFELFSMKKSEDIRAVKFSPNSNLLAFSEELVCTVLDVSILHDTEFTCSNSANAARAKFTSPSSSSSSSSCSLSTLKKKIPVLKTFSTIATKYGHQALNFSQDSLMLCMLSSNEGKVQVVSMPTTTTTTNEEVNEEEEEKEKEKEDWKKISEFGDFGLEIYCAVWNSKNEVAVSGDSSSGKNICVFDGATGELKLHISTGSARNMDIVYTPDEKAIVAGDNQGLTIYSCANDGAKLCEMNNNLKMNNNYDGVHTVYGVRVFGNFSSRDKSFDLERDVLPFQKASSTENNDNNILCSTEEEEKASQTVFAITCDQASTITWWARDGSIIRQVKSSIGQGFGIDTTNNKKHVAVSIGIGSDNIINLYDVLNGNLVCMIGSHAATPYNLCCQNSPNDVIASVGYDHCCRIWASPIRDVAFRQRVGVFLIKEFSSIKIRAAFDIFNVLFLTTTFLF